MTMPLIVVILPPLEDRAASAEKKKVGGWDAPYTPSIFIQVPARDMVEDDFIFWGQLLVCLVWDGMTSDVRQVEIALL